MRTPSAPFEPMHIRGNSITVDVSGKVLVLPTGHPYLLPSYNEYTLTVGRALPSAGTYTFTNDYETELGILNLNKNFIACYDPAGNEIDFYHFTYKPTQLKYIVDASGTITQLILYPGNGLIYHGQIHFSDLTRDTNSDFIPDFLDTSVLGSLTKFLQSYSTVDGTLGTKQFLAADGKEFLTADGKYLFVRA
jgi:hypothetical protein